MIIFFILLFFYVLWDAEVNFPKRGRGLRKRLGQLTATFKQLQIYDRENYG